MPIARPRLAAFAATLLISVAVAPQVAATTIEIPFDSSNFSNPTDINNPYWPEIPGTHFVYKADTEDGCEIDIVDVTNETRVIDSVETRKVHDQAFEADSCDEAGTLVEDTFDYYAQDDDDNVWYFGEDTFECEGVGNCTPGEGAWIAGEDGAVPGIVMLANPQSGDRYRQEFYPDHAEDQALVTATGITVHLRRDDAFAPGAFGNCITTKEWTELEPGSIEFKYYCPIENAGVGLVLTIEHHGKVLRSELTGGEEPDALEFRLVPGQ